MFITNVLVAGGVAYAGAKSVLDARRPAARLTAANGETQLSRDVATPVAEVNALAVGEPTLAERRQLAVAATSFWLTIGGLLFPPLTLASMPLTLYSTVPVVEAGLRSLFGEGRLRPSVINSVLLVTTLVSENYAPAAAIVFLHHSFRQLGQRLQAVSTAMRSEVSQDLGDLFRQAQGEPPRTIWVLNPAGDGQTVEMKVPFSELKAGDIIVVNRSEFIPAGGVVTAGSARVSLVLLNGLTTPVELKTGDRVSPKMFVIDGRILVRVAL